jgi:hypothetical protein
MPGLSFATWSLIVASSGMTAVAAVGAYQTTFVMPEYFSAPPASLRRYQSDKSIRFWLPLHGVTLAFLIAALITNWSTGRLALLLTATSCYAAAWVATFVFFIPGVIAFNKVDVTGPPSPELAAQGRRWLRRSAIRIALLGVAAACLVIGLGVTPR